MVNIKTCPFPSRDSGKKQTIDSNLLEEILISKIFLPTERWIIFQQGQRREMAARRRQEGGVKNAGLTCGENDWRENSSSFEILLQQLQ